MWKLEALIIVLLIVILANQFRAFHKWRKSSPPTVSVSTSGAAAQSTASTPVVPPLASTDVTTNESFDVMTAAKRAKSSTATFSNTLSRRMGMDAAGGPKQGFSSHSTWGSFDNFKQNFRVAPDSDDVAYGTQWAGYMNRDQLLG